MKTNSETELPYFLGDRGFCPHCSKVGLTISNIQADKDSTRLTLKCDFCNYQVTRGTKMSRSLYWKPLTGGNLIPEVEVRINLQKLFGDFPMTLSRSDNGVLEQLSVLEKLYEGKAEENPYTELYAAITQHGAIELWIEF